MGVVPDQLHLPLRTGLNMYPKTAVRQWVMSQTAWRRCGLEQLDQSGDDSGLSDQGARYPFDEIDFEVQSGILDLGFQTQFHLAQVPLGRQFCFTRGTLERLSDGLRLAFRNTGFFKPADEFVRVESDRGHGFKAALGGKREDRVGQKPRSVNHSPVTWGRYRRAESHDRFRLTAFCS